MDYNLTSLDHFDGRQLEMAWNFLRNPDSSLWSLEKGPGWLTLKGNANTVDSIDPTAFIGRRQEHHNCKVSTKLDFLPTSDNEEARISIFAGPNYHFDFAITSVAGKRHLIVRRNVDDIKIISHSIPIENGTVTLQIESNPWAFEYYYKVEEQPYKKIFHTQSRFLSTEFAGGFVGLYFGLYSTGNGKNSTTPAYFDWFNYEVTDGIR